LSFATIGPAPAIPRLNISAYQFGTECLSGDVEAGDATSFPMSIGMVRRRKNKHFHRTPERLHRARGTHFRKDISRHWGICCWGAQGWEK
jgi:beta-glucosidase